MSQYSRQVSELNVDIHKLFEDSCLTIEDGGQLYRIIHPALRDGTRVILDFNQVRFYASPFFNASIGRLLADLEPATLNSNLEFKNIPHHGIDVIKTVVEFAKRYYTDEQFKKQMDHMHHAETIQD